MHFKLRILPVYVNQNLTAITELLKKHTLQLLQLPFSVMADVDALRDSFLHVCTVSPSHSAEPMMAVGWKNIQSFRQWQTATAYTDRLKPSLSVISLYASSRRSSFC